MIEISEIHISDEPGKKRILVVEGDDGLRNLILESLRAYGYDAEGLATGNAAFECIATNQDLMLLVDQKLPDMPGADLIRSLIERDLRVPFVVMTGQGDERQAVEMMRLGASDYLSKHTDFVELLPGIVNRMFRERDRERQLRAAENVLRLKDEQLRTIFETSQAGIILVSPLGIIEFANNRMAEMFGMTLQELIGTSYSSHLHESESQIGTELLRQLIQGIIPSVDADRHYIRRDDTDFWGHLSIKRMENSDGSTQALVGSIADVTERKTAQKSLLESEERYRILFTRAEDGILVLSTEGRLIEVNESFAAMHGYSPREMLNMSLKDLDSPESSRLAPERIRRLLSGEGLTFEVGHYHRDGHIFPLEVAATLITAGDEAFILCFHRDITKRKQAEQERLLLEQQFQHAQKLESLGVLAGGIAHDFNNILAIIATHCSMARLDSEAAEESFTQIQTAIDRGAELSRQMLVYAGKAQVVLTSINMRLLVEDMVSMLRATLGKNISMTLDLASDISVITGDVSQLRQIVMNLIINAAEAIGKANGDISIKLDHAAAIDGHSDITYAGEITPSGRYLCLEITDNGCGMDDEVKNRIFEPFYSTKFAGRGLGMSATLGIITAHKGLLQFISQPGRGTTFKVYLPLPVGEEAGEQSQQQQSLPWKGSGTVLLVDDEPSILLSVSFMLKKLGFDVITASDGLEALEKYKKNRTTVDVVISDMGMPLMDGYELLQELKKINPELSVIISSGYGDAALDSGAQIENLAGLLNKPYSFEQLREMLRTL